ncbi:hypothetical protein [uncultured Dokdonia sp.]|uniref:hypothetical protein n=1 Tax=uncultured Dokdonia sp. TaxID=575653 RepID=UPI0030EDA00C|tara:strand:+ start:20445 stop:20966 length:522 start_codon:yes stop_codon:yes gene_type:complete
MKNTQSNVYFKLPNKENYYLSNGHFSFDLNVPRTGLFKKSFNREKSKKSVLKGRDGCFVLFIFLRHEGANKNPIKPGKKVKKIKIKGEIKANGNEQIGLVNVIVIHEEDIDFTQKPHCENLAEYVLAHFTAPLEDNIGFNEHALGEHLAGYNIVNPKNPLTHGQGGVLKPGTK